MEGSSVRRSLLEVKARCVAAGAHGPHDIWATFTGSTRQLPRFTRRAARLSLPVILERVTRFVSRLDGRMETVCEQAPIYLAVALRQAPSIGRDTRKNAPTASRGAEISTFTGGGFTHLLLPRVHHRYLGDFIAQRHRLPWEVLPLVCAWKPA